MTTIAFVIQSFFLGISVVLAEASAAIAQEIIEPPPNIPATVEWTLPRVD